MATERLKVILEMAAQQYKREAREAATATSKIAQEAKTADSATETMGGTFLKTGSILKTAGVAAGITAVGSGLWSTVEAAERINSIASITNQVIKQTGGVANVTADQILNMADKLEVLTGVESELVQEGSNVLLTFRNIRNEAGAGNDVFDRTVALMLDIGAVMGTDASSAALQLGKALNDPVSQMGALSRAGLTFNTEQKEMIKSLVASGDLLGAQKIILSELETQLGGTAAESVNASDRIANSWGQITDVIGLGLLPVLDEAAEKMGALPIAMGLLSGEITDAEAALLSFLNMTREEADSVADVVAGVDEVWRSWTMEIDVWRNRLDDGKTKTEDLAEAFELLISAQDLTSGGFDDFDQQLESAYAQGVITKQEWEAMSAVLEQQLIRQLYASRDAARHATGSTEELADANEDLEESTYDAAAALQEANDKLSTGIELLSEYYDIIDGRLDAVRRLNDAMVTAAEAQDVVNQMVEDGKSGTPEYIEAVDDLSIALQDVRAAEQSLVEQGGLTREEFIQQQIQMGLTRDQAILLADELDELFKPRYVHNQIINEITTQTTGGGSGGGGVQKLAAGGPAKALNLYRVGEQNKPELYMIPGESGSVFSNADAKALIAAFSGAGAGSATKQGPSIHLYGDINGVDEVMHAVQRAGGMVAMVDLAEVNPR